MIPKVGQQIDLQPDKRYVQHSRQHAIGDVYDALVELVTNCDDSYHHLYDDKKRSRDGGDILIEHQEQRKGKPSYLIVRDKAAGMDSRDMAQRLTRPGAYSGESGDRGYMGRGAKDCTELGTLTFESIKDGRYYRSKLSHDLKFVLEVDGTKATEAQRKTLGVERGNGTSVTLELLPSLRSARLPRFQSLVADLPWHYALRDIMAEESPSRVLLRKRGDAEPPVRATYYPPEGELVVDERLRIEGYPEASARLRVWRTSEPLEEAQGASRFERFGILIKDRRAIHECSLLTDELKRDPGARRYFGRIDCPYIDDLLLDYERRRAAGKPHSLTNPVLVIDPNRRFGLERRHPFSTRLLSPAAEHLRALLQEDRKRESSQKREVANRETKTRLDKLARLAARFINEGLDETEEFGGGDSVDDDAFTKAGVLIYPTYLRVAVGGERNLTVYIRRKLLDDGYPSVEIEADIADALQLPAPIEPRPHKHNDELLLASFSIKGLVAHDAVVLSTKCQGLPKAEAVVQVVETLVEDKQLASPLEFEHAGYSVRQGRKRSLKLLAKYPEAVEHDTDVEVSSSDASNVTIRGRCVICPVAGTNYAEGPVTIEGRRLNSRATITATINGVSTATSVRVVDKREEPSIPIKIDIRDEEFGAFRAKWADHEGQPNLLLISARHESLARYLGPADQDFPGQDLPLFRALLAEIVAESVCRKLLTLEAAQRPWEFRWADLKDDHVIADDVLAKLQQRLRTFVARAHGIMLADDEVPKWSPQ